MSGIIMKRLLLLACLLTCGNMLAMRELNQDEYIFKAQATEEYYTNANKKRVLYYNDESMTIYVQQKNKQQYTPEKEPLLIEIPDLSKQGAVIEENQCLYLPLYEKINETTSGKIELCFTSKEDYETFLTRINTIKNKLEENKKTHQAEKTINTATFHKNNLKNSTPSFKYDGAATKKHHSSYTLYNVEDSPLAFIIFVHNIKTVNESIAIDITNFETIKFNKEDLSIRINQIMRDKPLRAIELNFESEDEYKEFSEPINKTLANIKKIVEQKRKNEKEREEKKLKRAAQQLAQNSFYKKLALASFVACGLGFGAFMLHKIKPQWSMSGFMNLFSSFKFPFMR
jgi:hypothetical protein